MILGEVLIQEERDIVMARRQVREFVKKMDFGLVDETRIVTAVSELSRNILEYAHNGKVVFESAQDGDRSGIAISFIDHGPGIANLDNAFKEGFSTGKGMGLGLPGARRLMNSFTITSEAGVGTTIIIKKWK